MSLRERDQALKAKNTTLDAKNTTHRALEVANIQLDNMRKRVEELTIVVASMDTKLTTCNNWVTSLEVDVGGKETALQERDEQLRFQGVEFGVSDLNHL